VQLHLATLAADVYTNFMASLHKKTVHGHTYWQIVESRRVHGKPRPVVLAHLGKADELLNRLRHNGKPVEAVIRDFGAVAALWAAAEELDLRSLINAQVPKRHQGHAVADYLLLAAISRAVQPFPKTRIAHWYRGTVLQRLLPMSHGSLSSQRFWDHMNFVDRKILQRIEEDLSRRLVEHHGIDLETLFFDATNFDTFIDSQNSAELPQRGHAKSKRTDLRVVGLALMVSADFHIPLFWEVYPGNQPDSSTFAKVLPTLAQRHRQLLAGTDQHITLVFDKGNNSTTNLEQLTKTLYHVIGSLVPSQHTDLLAIPLDRFRRLPSRFGKTWVYRTTKEVFGRNWTIVVTRSHSLLTGQVRGIRQQLAKKLKGLAELQDKLTRSQQGVAHGKPYTRASLEKHLQELTRGQYIAAMLRAKVVTRRGKLRLDYGVDQAAFQQLRREVLGKRILFTDNASWTNDRIVEGYRGQHHVERAFRDLKDPELVQVAPMFHWTDSKIRVHVFTCVLAMTLQGLVQRRVVQAGLDLSCGSLMRELREIREVTNLYLPAGQCQGRPRTETVLSRRTALQKRLCAVLELEHFLSR